MEPTPLKLVDEEKVMDIRDVVSRVEEVVVEEVKDGVTKVVEVVSSSSCWKLSWLSWWRKVRTLPATKILSSEKTSQ